MVRVSCHGKFPFMHASSVYGEAKRVRARHATTLLLAKAGLLVVLSLQFLIIDGSSS